MLKRIILLVMLAAAFAATGTAQKKNAKIDVGEALKGYFKPVTTPSASPDANGFIRRWMMLEPISKPNSTNRVFTDTYTRENLSVEYFPDQLTVIPKDGDKVKVTMEYQPPVNLTSNRPTTPQPEQPKFVKATLTWHALDSDHFFALSKECQVYCGHLLPLDHSPVKVPKRGCHLRSPECPTGDCGDGRRGSPGLLAPSPGLPVGKVGVHLITCI